MFTSKIHLANNLGVDPDIAAFFVDRKVPENNTYWKGRLLYVAGGTGYLFIPLWFDIQFKCGVNKTILLSEAYVFAAEEILNSAGKHENNEINFETHIDNCKALLSGKIKQPHLYSQLLAYFSDAKPNSVNFLGTPSKALARGDTMLFQLCMLEDTHAIQEMIGYWYTLVPSFLLMDDVMDLHEDKRKGEENSIADFGEGSNGLHNALAYLRSNFLQMKQKNEKLGLFFENSLNNKIATPYLQHLLNN